jgi:hypothetical protein
MSSRARQLNARELNARYISKWDHFWDRLEHLFWLRDQTKRHCNEVSISETHIQQWSNHSEHMRDYCMRSQEIDSLFAEEETYELRNLRQSNAKRAESFVLCKMRQRKRLYNLYKRWDRLSYLQVDCQVKTRKQSKAYVLIDSSIVSESDWKPLTIHQTLYQLYVVIVFIQLRRWNESLKTNEIDLHHRIFKSTKRACNDAVRSFLRHEEKWLNTDQ